MRGRRKDALFPEYIKNRFLTSLSIGRGNGYIPYEKRVHQLRPFEEILLRRHIEQHIEHYMKTRYMADVMGITDLPRSSISALRNSPPFSLYTTGLELRIDERCMPNIS